MKLYLKISEFIDYLSSNPLFLIVFNALLCTIWYFIGLDGANIFISIITAELVLLAASSNRRGFLALQAKLDEIIKINPGARDDLLALENLEEKRNSEIKERRLNVVYHIIVCGVSGSFSNIDYLSVYI